MKSRNFKALFSILLILSMLVTMLPIQATAMGNNGVATGTITPFNLTVENLKNPMGIDILRPNLSWIFTSDGHNQEQTAYRILVASSLAKLEENDGDLWDSGKVISEKSFNVAYGGLLLKSRQRAYWKVMTWDKNDVSSVWSESAYWELGLINDSDWEAKWIGQGGDVPAEDANIFTDTFNKTTSRYVKISVSELGPEAQGFPGQHHLQLMEFEIYDSANPTVNLARGKSVAASSIITNNTVWQPSNLTNGTYNSGYSSNMFNNAALSTPLTITIDLGANQSFDTIKLYCRTDFPSTTTNICPNYPKKYTIEHSADNDIYSELQTVSISDPPRIPGKPIDTPTSMPLFATDFQVDDLNEVVSARLYISGLGLYETHINGQNVSPNTLEPGETNYDKSILYVTYDVKDFLTEGGNAIGIMLGNGMYNVGATPAGRYKWGTVNGTGPLATIAQLELTMKDGSVQKIFTGEDWKSTNGPITVSTWYGGEDYDATKEVEGWDQPGTDRSTWDDTSKVAITGTLEARKHPPIQVVEEIVPASVIPLAGGKYLLDMGQNFAGYLELRLTGTTAANRGTKIQFWPGEHKNADNTVNQNSAGVNRWNSYTVKGTGNETWHPQFCYDGFRYVEIRNFPGVPTVDNFRGYAMRTSNEKSGTFETSNSMLNGIDKLVTRAVESNMYSTLTDCPHREKLGYLEVSHLMYYSMAYQFDIQAWMKKITKDMIEAQHDDGMIPTTAPEFGMLPDPYLDEATWGGASVLDPWYTYQVYGDKAILEMAYPMMVRYVDYLTSKSKNNLLDYGLGDWGGYDTSTPVGLVVSSTYYDLSGALSEIASILGHDSDAQKYANLAAAIKTSFNNTYYNAATGQYGSGSQASNACALFTDLVEEENIDKVLDNLVANIESRGWHLSTGEVGLREMFVTLAKYGRSDVVYKMATNKTIPSYWYFVENGATSLPEFWDMAYSHNHCMLGHIQEWFYRYLAGIDHSSPGFKDIVIKPYIPDDLEEVKASTMTSYGRLTSNWQYQDGNLTMNIQIPVGTTADIYVPRLGFKNTAVSVNGGEISGTVSNDYILLSGMGSGTYKITRQAAPIVGINLSSDKSVIEIGTLADVTGIAGQAKLTVTGVTSDEDILPISNSKLTFSADPQGIVSIDSQTGLVSGLSDGDAVITARYGEFEKSINISVNTTGIESISLIPTKKNLNYVGDELRLTVSGTTNSGRTVDLTGYSGLAYENGNPSAVTVLERGRIRRTASGEGETALIQARLGELQSQVEITLVNAVNLALKSNGLSAVRCSSYHNGQHGNYIPDSAIDGDRTGNRWSNAGGWSAEIVRDLPDWFQIDFDGKKTISEISLFNLQNNFSTASVPTLDTICTSYALSEFRAEYWDGDTWVPVPNGYRKDNNKAWVQIAFEPITTNRVRLVCLADQRGDNSRIVEFEVYEAVGNLPDPSVEVRVNGQPKTDIVTATLINDKYSCTIHNDRLLAGIVSNAVIELDVAGNYNTSLLELDISLIKALKGKNVSIRLSTPNGSMTLYPDDIGTDILDTAVSTRSSAAILAMRIDKTAPEKMETAINELVISKSSELYGQPQPFALTVYNFNNTVHCSDQSVVMQVPINTEIADQTAAYVFTPNGRGIDSAKVESVTFHEDDRCFLKTAKTAAGTLAVIKNTKAVLQSQITDPETNNPITGAATNQPFILSVTTTGDVSKIKVVNENDMTIGKTLLERAVNPDGTITWRYAIELATAGENRTISILTAGSDGLYAGPGVALTLDITPVTPAVVSAVPLMASADKNEEFTVIVTTTKTVDKIKLTNESGASVGIISKSFVITGNNKIWTISTKVGTYGLNRTLKIFGAPKNEDYLPASVAFNMDILKP